MMNSHCTPTDRRGHSAKIFGNRSTALAAILASLGAAAAYYAICLVQRGVHTVADHLAAIVVAVAAAVAVVLCLSRLQRVMNAVSAELETMAGTGEIGHVSGRGAELLVPVVRPINNVLARCRQEMDALRDVNRELKIQARVTDAEKQHTEAIIDSISDAVVVTNRFDELAMANAAAEELFDFTIAGALRKSINHVVNDGTLVRLIADTRKHGHTQRRKVVSHSVDTDGETRTFGVTLCCTTDKRGEVSGVVAVLHDVTKEKEVGQMKTDFVSNVSHELRTPLAGIKAYIEMLLDGDAEDPKTRREFHEIISSETDRLSRLIDNILDIARIESGVVKVACEPMDPTAVVKATLEVANPQAAMKNIELAEELAPVYAQIEADRDMINQAVMNLVSNAIKYTPEGGRVTVSTKIDERHGVVVFSVADTGVGIGPEDLPHLFDKFYRVRGSSKMAQGTGLGLSLGKHIVETLHRGRLSVTSKRGEGSVFSFELPICQ